MLEHSDPPGADVAIEAQADVAPLDAVGSAPAAVVAPVPELSPAACAARLAELFPAVFSPGAPQPLKLRIQADIQERAPGVFTRKTLSGFLHRHTTSTAYLRALVNAPQRIDLDGTPAGEVAGEHREAAIAELQRRRTLHEARRAAEREAQRAAQRQSREAQNAQNAQNVQNVQNTPSEVERQAEREAQRAARTAHAEAQRAGRAAHAETQRAENAAHADARRTSAAQDEERRKRQALLRAFEASTLSRSNFCALKGMTQVELDALLAQARQDPPAPAVTPATPVRTASPGGGDRARQPRNRQGLGRH